MEGLPFDKNNRLTDISFLFPLQFQKYIVLDKGMIPMLRRYKEDGVKLFLLTNSFWEYTSTAMNYL